LSKIIAAANCTPASQKISGEFVVAGGDGPEVLELTEEALDEVACAVEREIVQPLGLAIGLGRDDRG
jgi:hypothetical protein